VIVRGKAGAELEFGNTLYLAEQRNGLIVDWHLYREQAPGDTRITADKLCSLSEQIQISSLTGDRGCDSKKNRDLLAEKAIFNGLCPRNPQELIKRLKEPRFRECQRRRGQTEGRIGIFKNVISSSPIRTQNFEVKERKIAWAVLAHNLWVLARLPMKEMLAKAG